MTDMSLRSQEVVAAFGVEKRHNMSPLRFKQSFENQVMHGVGWFRFALVVWRVKRLTAQ